MVQEMMTLKVHVNISLLLMILQIVFVDYRLHQGNPPSRLTDHIEILGAEERRDTDGYRLWVQF